MNRSSGRHILIMAGGTGGHVYPALATARQLLDAGYHVEWLGTHKGIEARLVPGAGIKLHCISISGIRGKRLATLVKAPFQLVLALSQALAVCLRYRPACVLGMGGFASGPGGMAAWIMRIPLVIQEQNAIPGTTNRILARFARTVFEGFDGAFETLPAQFSGNPVREDIVAIAPPQQRFAARSGCLRVLVLGGSLGAQALNQVLPEALALMPPERRPLLRHQSGEKQYQETQRRYQHCGVDAEVTAYIENMAEAYAWADLVVCRAGALTVSELAAAGVAAILVPFPHAVDDHQTHNARWLVQRGAAILMAQPQLNATRLAERFDQWHGQRGELIKMAECARAASRPGAARMVAARCMELADGQ